MSKPNEPKEKSAAELEQEINEHRTNLTSTFAEVSDRMDPTHLIDDAKEYINNNFMNSGASHLADDFVHVVQRNPVPIGIMIAGATWAVWSESQQSSHSNASNSFENQTITGNNQQQTNSKLSQLVPDRVNDLSHSARQELDKGIAMSQEYGNNAKNKAQNISSQISSFVTERPVMTGLLGLAIGACVGAMMPTTQSENRAAGRVRDQAKNKFAESADQMTQSIKEAAQHTKEDLAQSFEDQGLTGSSKDQSAQAKNASANSTRQHKVL